MKYANVFIECPWSFEEASEKFRIEHTWQFHPHFYCMLLL